jgi:hypothetical protein
MKRMLFATLATAAALTGGQALVPGPAAAMDEAGGDSGSATTCPISSWIWDVDEERFTCDSSKEGGGGSGSSSGSGGGSGAGTPGSSSGAGSGGSAGTRSGTSRGPGLPEDLATAALRDMREACLGLWRRIERADRDEDDVERRHGRVSRALGKNLRKKWVNRGCNSGGD